MSNQSGDVDSLAESSGESQREQLRTAIREGLADVEAGRTKPARAALRALAKQHGISLPGQ